MSHPPARLTAALAGRYRLEHQLGAGGRAVVYPAEDVRHVTPDGRFLMVGGDPTLGTHLHVVFDGFDEARALEPR